MAAGKLDVVKGTPGSNMAVGRCYGSEGKKWNRSDIIGHGVTWKPVAGATLKHLRCPEHDGPLYQTTRAWQVDEWTVIPPAVVLKVARAQRARDAEAEQALIDAGTHKRVRDLQPGDVFSEDRHGSGKLVEVRKEKNKYCLVVSRPYDDVATSAVVPGSWNLTGIERLAAEATLTEVMSLPGSRLVKVAWTTPMPWDAKDWRGWAVDDPRCLVEYWRKKIAWLEEGLHGEGKRFLAAWPTQRQDESDEDFTARKERAREAARTAREAAEAELTFAQTQLARLTI